MRPIPRAGATAGVRRWTLRVAIAVGLASVGVLVFSTLFGGVAVPVNTWMLLALSATGIALWELRARLTDVTLPVEPPRRIPTVARLLPYHETARAVGQPDASIGRTVATPPKRGFRVRPHPVAASDSVPTPLVSATDVIEAPSTRPAHAHWATTVDVGQLALQEATG